MLCVPGGFGVNALLTDDETLDYVRQLAGSARYITSVCTGALVLGDADREYGVGPLPSVYLDREIVRSKYDISVFEFATTRGRNS